MAEIKSLRFALHVKQGGVDGVNSLVLRAELMGATGPWMRLEVLLMPARWTKFRLQAVILMRCLPITTVTPPLDWRAIC